MAGTRSTSAIGLMLYYHSIAIVDRFVQRKKKEGRKKIDVEMQLKQWFPQLRTSGGTGRGCYFFFLPLAILLKN